jgi:hypothetical protein
MQVPLDFVLLLSALMSQFGNFFFGLGDEFSMLCSSGDSLFTETQPDQSATASVFSK